MINHKKLDHGDEITVQYELSDGLLTPGWDGIYLTTENKGNGPMMRVRRHDDGVHVHVNPRADDVKITRY